MLELFLSTKGRKKNSGTPLPEVEAFNPLPNIPNRSVRIYATLGARAQVGIMEFWLYEKNTNFEYMHGGAVQEARHSYDINVDGFGPYTPNLTYDGDASNWQSSSYLDVSPNREKYLQWNFNRNVNPGSWTIQAEATWFPLDNGLELYLFDGAGWINITGTQTYPWSHGLRNSYNL